MQWVKCNRMWRVHLNKLPVKLLVLLALQIGEIEMRAVIRFRWQSGAIALAAITLAFILPGIALCKVVPLVSIALAIAITTLIAGLGLYWVGRSIEKRTPQCERVDYYLQASILVTTAGLLWFLPILQSGPWRERTIEPRAALPILIVCTIAGALLLIRRGRRLAGNGPG